MRVHVTWKEFGELVSNFESGSNYWLRNADQVRRVLGESVASKVLGHPGLVELVPHKTPVLPRVEEL